MASTPLVRTKLWVIFIITVVQALGEILNALPQLL